MKIGIAGVGRIGLPLSLVYAKAGNEVTAVDINPNRIADIKNNNHFAEPLVNDYLEKYGKNITFTADSRQLIGCDIVTIMVNTPSLQDGSFDTSTVEKIVKEIHSMDEDVLAAVSSNVNIGTCDQLRKLHEHIACCPEFIAQGSTIRDFENPKFTVIGAYDRVDAEKLRILWHKIHHKPIYVVTPTEAEIIKLSLNVSYCMGITWANIIGELSAAHGANSDKILDIMHKDWRNYKKGLGFGGPCFPRDVNCFRIACEQVGSLLGVYLATVLNYLNLRIEVCYQKELEKLLKSKKRAVGFLGVAYKSGVPYVWGSQALNIALDLEKLGYKIHVYDPSAQNEAKKFLKKAAFHETIEECVEKTDVIFVGTPNYKDVTINKPVVNPWR